jgi:hypothetical protein|tara:strand:+ start:344 stop:841 length:498 start_codon:yes stop_codon:yes gene_type:complete
MKKKGQQGIGGMVVLFIGIIFVFALLPAIADGVDTLRTTRDAVNTSFTFSTVGVPVAIEGQELIGTPTVTNTSGTALTTNLTIDEGLSAADGGKSVQVTLTGNGFITDDINYTDTAALISYTYGADGYAESSGTRGVAFLIVILAALGLLGFVVFYAIGKSGMFR